jgi:hypothetical protein
VASLLCGDVKNVGYLDGLTSVQNVASLDRRVNFYGADSCYNEDFPPRNNEGFQQHKGINK